MGNLVKLLGRLLCVLGFHRFRLLEVTEAFGPAGVVEKVECKRCKIVATRTHDKG